MYVSDLFHLLYKINRVCLHDQIKFIDGTRMTRPPDRTGRDLTDQNGYGKSVQIHPIRVICVLSYKSVIAIPNPGLPV